MKKEQVMMPEVNVIVEVIVNEKTIKGLEVLFQDKIEKTAEANGHSDCWWQILGHEEDIFWTLFNYNKIDTKEEGLKKMQEYYNYLKDKVNKWVGEKLCM